MAGHKSLKETAKENPTALGDPVSLKAETSDTQPTENDKPNNTNSGQGQNQCSKTSSAKSQLEDVKKLAPTEKDVDENQTKQNPTLNPSNKHNKSLKELAHSNPTMIGDPVSLKAETSDHDPVKDDASKEDGTGRSGATPQDKKARDSKL